MLCLYSPLSIVLCISLSLSILDYKFIVSLSHAHKILLQVWQRTQYINRIIYDRFERIDRCCYIWLHYIHIAFCLLVYVYVFIIWGYNKKNPHMRFSNSIWASNCYMVKEIEEGMSWSTLNDPRVGTDSWLIMLLWKHHVNIWCILPYVMSLYKCVDQMYSVDLGKEGIKVGEKKIDHIYVFLMDTYPRDLNIFMYFMNVCTHVHCTHHIFGILWSTNSVKHSHPRW